LLGDFFYFFRFFDYGKGEDVGGIGEADFLFEISYQGVEAIDVGADLALILFVDGFLIGRSGAWTIYALREIGIRGVGRRFIRYLS